MPRPPDLPDFDKLNFITAYMFQLCVPPFWAFVEFAKEPAGNLVLIVLGLDTQDILKEWLRPSRGRYRDPARHGKKRPKKRFSLDPNEYVSSKPRSMAKEYPGIKLPGAKALFYLSDQWDKVAITGAVLEGVTDIGFQSLLGVIKANPDNCPTLPIAARHASSSFQMPGVIPDDDVIQADVLDAAQFFFPAGPVAYRTFESKWTLGWAATIEPYSLNGCENWAPGIYSSTRGMVALGNHHTLDQGAFGHVEVSAELEPGEFAWPVRRTDRGSVWIHGMNVFAFGGGLW